MPSSRPVSPASPLAWGAASRLMVAMALGAALWGAVGWALGWW